MSGFRSIIEQTLGFFTLVVFYTFFIFISGLYASFNIITVIDVLATFPISLNTGLIKFLLGKYITGFSAVSNSRDIEISQQGYQFFDFLLNNMDKDTLRARFRHFKVHISLSFSQLTNIGITLSTLPIIISL